jgi:hypothetical protein
MAQVIIFENENGGVSVCYPTGELSIEETQAKDTPEGSIIIDASELPQGEYEFFNAWELINGKVVVNQTKKQAIIDAKQEAIDAQQSAVNKLKAIGLTDEEIQALKGAK